MASSIEWTDETWNPVTGCSKVSQGCKNCYAERMAKRLQAMKQPRYLNGFDVTIHPDLLDKPAQWKKPKKIFVNSMSDLFHKDVPESFITDVFDKMCEYNWHTYQVLTKRPERMADFSMAWPPDGNWSIAIPKHIWLGTSIENMDVIGRVDELLKVKSPNRFLSCEPLLGPLDLDKYLATGGIHWVIVGGESGPKSRPIDEQWVRGIRDQCQQYKVPFFFKQWGGNNKKKTGHEIDGKEYLELPSEEVLHESNNR